MKLTRGQVRCAHQPTRSLSSLVPATHPEEERQTGFDFLGATLRKYGGKLLMMPSRKSVKAFLSGIRETIKAHAGVSMQKLIGLLNPRIRGWANYFRHLVSSKVFQKVDTAIFDAMVRWMRRRHPRKGLSWLRTRYFRSNGTRRWIITASPGKADGSTSPSDLVQASSLPIRRHVKVRAEATAFDPEFQTYFRQRRGGRKRAGAATQARAQRLASRTSRQQQQPRPGHVAVAQGKA